MDSITHWLWPDGRFCGLTWLGFWTGIGWLANVIFTSRFLVQWYATEKRKQVTVPAIFWWLSLVGALLILSYAISRKDLVFIFANAFNWIPYSRNLVIHYRHKNAEKTCAACGERCNPRANYCPNCGARLPAPAV
jgi:lipid-A-disaccharide synthase-like uncharacterized protein